LTYILETNTTNGTITGTPPNLTYTPNMDYDGDDSFTFKVNDGEADSELATISIIVTPPTVVTETYNCDYSATATPITESCNYGATATASTEACNYPALPIENDYDCGYDATAIACTDISTYTANTSINTSTYSATSSTTTTDCSYEPLHTPLTSCPNEGTLNAGIYASTSCDKTCDTTTYSCPNGASLNGGTCNKTCSRQVIVP